MYTVPWILGSHWFNSWGETDIYIYNFGYNAFDKGYSGNEKSPKVTLDSFVWRRE